MIRQFTIDELTNVRSKPPAKTTLIESKYQEALKLFRVIIENANSRQIQLDGRSLVESIVSILCDESWATCSIVIKELSHLLLNNVLNFHEFSNEFRQNEWRGESNARWENNRNNESVFLRSLHFVHDVVETKWIWSIILQFTFENCRRKIHRFRRFWYEISSRTFWFSSISIRRFKVKENFSSRLRKEKTNICFSLRNSTNFSVIEHFLGVLNIWTSKFLFEMSDEIFAMSNDVLPCLLTIWRKKCNDRTKVKRKRTFFFARCQTKMFDFFRTKFSNLFNCKWKFIIRIIEKTRPMKTGR